MKNNFKLIFFVLIGISQFVLGITGIITGVTVVACPDVNCAPGPDEHFIGGWEGITAAIGYMIIGFAFLYAAYVGVRYNIWGVDVWTGIFTTGVLVLLAGLLSHLL